MGQRSVVARILQFEIKMTFLHLARILMENVSTHQQSTLSLEENLEEKKNFGKSKQKSTHSSTNAPPISAFKGFGIEF